MAGRFHPGWFVLAGSADIVQIASYRGILYGGESAAWGPNAAPATAGGKIVKLRDGGDGFDTVFETGCSCITHMTVLQDCLCVAGIDPDRLYVMDARERITLVAELPGETPADQARSFGAAVAEQDGTIYWGRSDRTRPHVYAITQDGR